MCELEQAIERFLAELAREGSSPHSLRAYAGDLRQFQEFLSPPEMAPPAPAEIDLLTLREWMLWLYRQHLSAVSIRRKLAAVRGLFRYLDREGVVTANWARLLRTPKAPQRQQPDGR